MPHGQLLRESLSVGRPPRGLSRAGQGGRVFPNALSSEETALTPTLRMPKGATLSPKGDIGKYRQEESVKVGGFKAGSTVSASKRIK